MSRLTARRDLPRDVNDELQEIFHRLIATALVPHLLKILTPQELRSLGVKKGELKRISIRSTLKVVASSRQLSLERAALELARAVDLIGVGKYERLRTAIGEPVTRLYDDVPKWDATGLELRFHGRPIRTLSPRAKNCKRILDAFHDDGWPPRIESPLPGGRDSRKLRETVRTLNDGLTSIRFFCDGTGEGVSWQEVW
jgi:hypothetical protein